MSDIVERLRGLRFVHVPVASQLMEEAAREIESLRLTDAERGAVEWAAIRSAADAQMIGGDFYLACHRMRARSATLRTLLERMK